MMLNYNFFFASAANKVQPWLKKAFLTLVFLLLTFGAYRLIPIMTPASPAVYKIGLDSTWYPLTLYGKEHSITAFSTDLLFAIARNQSIKIEIVRTGHLRLMELLEDGFVDGVLTALTPAGKLEDQFYFSDPYYRFGAVLIVPKDSLITSTQQLQKKILGIRRSSPLLYRLPIDPETAIVPYENLLTMLKDLSENKVDAVLMDQLLLYLYFGALYKDQLKVATLPLTKDGLRLVTLQERYTKKLIKKFNRGLKALQEDGSYDRLLNQWDLYDPEKLIP